MLVITGPESTMSCTGPATADELYPALTITVVSVLDTTVAGRPANVTSVTLLPLLPRREVPVMVTIFPCCPMSGLMEVIDPS